MAYGHDAVTRAAHEALKPIVHLETTWNQGKLESRICSYFRNASKTMAFEGKPWQDLLLEFTGYVFASIFQAIPDRTWLTQVDFMPVLSASAKEVFPPNMLAEVSPLEFEQTLLCAHDQSFEEQRFAVILDEVLRNQIKEKKARNRVYTAFEHGRKEAVQADLSESANPTEDFAYQWISCSIKRLRIECSGWPENALTQKDAVWLFNSLIDQGVFPVSLIAFSGPLPSGWPVITTAVHMAYNGPASKGAGKAGKPGKCEKKTADVPDALAWSLYGRGSPNSARSSQKGAGKGNGHPKCTQAEDCLGEPGSPLFQHVEASVGDGAVAPGDVYCATCWKAFHETDPSLQAVPFPTA